MSLTEKVAYIKGVVSGMNFDTATSEGKVIELIIDLLDDIAHDVTEIEEDVDSLNAYVEEVDEDLGFVEDIVYEDEECNCCDIEDFECDGDCSECICDEDCDSCERGGAYDFFEVVCPTCNEKVYLDNSLDPTKVRCPSCHNEFSVIDNN